VAGIRTPQDITERAQGIRLRQAVDGSGDARGLCRARAHLRHARKHYRDMQDIEFTVEQGKLWMLQTRNGKRTAKAALKIAVELASEGLITQSRGGHGASSPARSTSCCTRPSTPRPSARSSPPACRPRRARPRGEIVFNSDEAETRPRRAARSSWCASRPRPEDIHGMHAAEGILTTRGGMTSTRPWWRAAWASPASPAPAAIRVDYASQTLTAGGPRS
jgi:pyruvate,orthophosphate dikinase